MKRQTQHCMNLKPPDFPICDKWRKKSDPGAILNTAGLNVSPFSNSRCWMTGAYSKELNICDLLLQNILTAYRVNSQGLMLQPYCSQRFPLGNSSSRCVLNQSHRPRTQRKKNGGIPDRILKLVIEPLEKSAINQSVDYIASNPAAARQK